MALDRQMANRQALAAPERLPLLEPDFHSDPVELAPHRHRHGRERRMYLVLELELANHGCCSKVRLQNDHSSRVCDAGACFSRARDFCAGALSSIMVAPRPYS